MENIKDQETIQVLKHQIEILRKDNEKLRLENKRLRGKYKRHTNDELEYKEVTKEFARQLNVF